MSTQGDLEQLAREACRCRYCFDQLDLGLTAPTIAIAQPRWVGPRYWHSPKRILIVLLNPGSGEGRNDDADAKMYQELLEFRDRRTTLDAIFAHQAKDMPNWGRSGNFLPYYVAGLDLELDDLAFVNIAWCATAGNRYPSQMLSNCYDRFTSRLVAILSPRNVLLSGSKIPPSVYKNIRTNVPNAKLIPMMHYAHREGGLAQDEELRRVRARLSE